MHRAGWLTTPAGDILRVTCALFDSGSSSEDNYMSTAYYQQNRKYLKNYFMDSESRVMVANGVSVPLRGHVVLDLTFPDDDGNRFCAERIKFRVLDGNSKDLIIGIPTIAKYFRELFLDMVLRIPPDNFGASMSSDGKHINYTYTPSGMPTVYPWSEPIILDTPEEDMVPEPCSFSWAVHYMEMSVEDAKQEYLNNFATRVAPEFAAATSVNSMLTTLGLDVFVPTNWKGVSGPGLRPIHIKFREDMPRRIKPATRNIPPRLREVTLRELERMCQYFYEDSNSPISSPLTVAPKATNPGIRICGDYRVPNLYIDCGHYPIPNIIHQLHKMSEFECYHDLDVTNAFHQMRLHEETSRMLSVQTPLGQKQPIFMPEGVAPATHELQYAMETIFHGFEEWTIVLFDNLLVLCHDYNDGFLKLELILKRCKEYNLFLKLSKSKFGIKSVEFFGYLCEHGSYRLTDERRASVTSIPFPEPPQQLKKMQRFLGAANYFKPFIDHYSDLTAPLHDMTKKDFDWNPKTWQRNYTSDFELFKDAILHSMTLYHPDYSLEWRVQVDASEIAVGGVLVQVVVDSRTGERQYQVIAVVSYKFSEAATRWHTIEQECFAIFYVIKKLSYYLYGKHFVLETDHANLLWMEKSEVKKIIRQRIYIQHFSFDVAHIKGSRNKFADMQSRRDFVPDTTNSESPRNHLLPILSCKTNLSPPAGPTWYQQPCDDAANPISFIEDATDLSFEFSHNILATLSKPKPNSTTSTHQVPFKSPDDALRLVHNGRVGHHGVRRTWLKLNKLFPGHRIPIAYIDDYINRCALCQKLRLGMADSLESPLRVLKSTHFRHFVGFDTLTISPPDKDGHCCIHVVRMLPSRLTGLYPAKDYHALGVAHALFDFFTSYGISDVLITDPGSNITAEVTQQLITWFGVQHRLSLVDRHESNLVERTNSEILRFITALCSEERIVDRWGSPMVIKLVQFIINSEISAETSHTPFELCFGSADAPYFQIQQHFSKDATTRTKSFLEELNSDLSALRQLANTHLHERQGKRLASNLPEHLQNEYQPGDLVLKQLDPSKPKPSKLHPKYLGPYRVVGVYKADIECKHLVSGAIQTFHASRLKPFWGSAEDAYKVALLDQDQYVIDDILAYRGDPHERTTMEFEVAFADGTVVWLPWSHDLFNSVPYEEFCRRHRPLFPLIYTRNQAQTKRSDFLRRDITEVVPGQIVFVDLRAWGAEWYRQMNLPNKDHTNYVVECRYLDFTRRSRKRITLECPLFHQIYTWSAYDIYLYGTVDQFDLRTMVLVDSSFISNYPRLLD